MPSKKYRYESMYIRQSHKRRYDSGCAEVHIISTLYFTWEKNIDISRDIPTDMLPAASGMPSVWLMSEEIDINKYILLLLY